MKRCLLLILVLSLLVSGFLTGCGAGLQTFSKHDISFKVANSLRLEEYTFNIHEQTLRKGSTSYDEGMVMSTEKNFILIWLTAVPKFTPEEIRFSILSTPDTFQSASRTFQAKITGDLTTQRIADFEVTFADMQFTQPGWKATGITAVWYCPTSQRMMQLILIHKQPEREMKRFIRSFSCTPHD